MCASETRSLVLSGLLSLHSGNSSEDNTYSIMNEPMGAQRSDEENVPVITLARCHQARWTKSSWQACWFPVEPGVFEPTATILNGISVYTSFFTDPPGATPNRVRVDTDYMSM